MSLPFVLRYSPKQLSDVIGNEKAKELLRNHIKTKSKKGLLLEGPTGSGKTSAVVAIANELSLELVEMNASDVRNQKGIDAGAGASAMQMSLFSSGKIILIDEIDGVSGMKDRGGIKAIIELIAKTPFPVVLTANDVSESKFSALRRAVQRIEWKAPSASEIQALLAKVLKDEKITADEGVLSGIAHRSGGDVRAALTDLEVISTSNKKLTKKDLEVLSGRNREQDMNNVLFRIFRTKDAKIAREALDASGEDLDECLLWIEENLPLEYQTVQERSDGFSWLAGADVFRGRIRRKQHWRFLATIAPMISGGVSVSRTSKVGLPVAYKRPGRILKMWIAKQRQASKLNTAKKLSPFLHISSKEAYRSSLPLLKHLFMRDRQVSAWLADRYKLEPEDLAWLSKEV